MVASCDLEEDNLSCKCDLNVPISHDSLYPGTNSRPRAQELIIQIHTAQGIVLHFCIRLSNIFPAPVREEAGAGEEVHVAQLGHGAVLVDNGPVEPGEHLNRFQYKTKIDGAHYLTIK